MKDGANKVVHLQSFTNVYISNNNQIFNFFDCNNFVYNLVINTKYPHCFPIVQHQISNGKTLSKALRKCLMSLGVLCILSAHQCTRRNSWRRMLGLYHQYHVLQQSYYKASYIRRNIYMYQSLKAAFSVYSQFTIRCLVQYS